MVTNIQSMLVGVSEGCLSYRHICTIKIWYYQAHLQEFSTGSFKRSINAHFEILVDLSINFFRTRILVDFWLFLEQEFAHEYERKILESDIQFSPYHLSLLAIYNKRVELRLSFENPLRKHLRSSWGQIEVLPRACSGLCYSNRNKTFSNSSNYWIIW